MVTIFDIIMNCTEEQDATVKIILYCSRALSHKWSSSFQSLHISWTFFFSFFKKILNAKTFLTIQVYLPEYSFFYHYILDKGKSEAYWRKTYYFNDSKNNWNIVLDHFPEFFGRSWASTAYKSKLYLFRTYEISFKLVKASPTNDLLWSQTSFCNTLQRYNVANRSALRYLSAEDFPRKVLLT